jgi:signal transduction histidine kinase
VHHLRNLLLPITGHASLLLDDASLPESAKNGLRDMSEAADQILKVINGIDQESRG